MLEYSPYHNIGKKNYPHMLITGGINDPRVSFWEPTKYVARLRANKTDTNLLLLKTYHSGHMGASGRYSSFVGTAFQYAFLIHQLGIATGGVYKTKSSLRVVDSVAITPTELLAMFQAFQVTAIISSALKLVRKITLMIVLVLTRWCYRDFLKSCKRVLITRLTPLNWPWR